LHRSGCISSIHKTKDGLQFDMTLRKTSVVNRLTISDIIPRKHLNGTVKSVVDFGIFISITGSALVAFCHISEVSDDYIEGGNELRKLYSRGDRVRMHVLAVDKQKNKIWVSLKDSLFKESEKDENLSEGEMGIEEAEGVERLLKAETSQKRKREETVEEGERKKKKKKRKKGRGC